jgi:energy-coupling factor transporter ATP-binding protein EcfA2
LKNKKVLQTGEERSDLSIVAFHKGSRVKKLSSLSGGEGTRLTLAFQLALSDLYRSPILLVDEALTGLLPDERDGCLEVLKMASQNKLVLVIEHGAPESCFDTVVDF